MLFEVALVNGPVRLIWRVSWVCGLMAATRVTGRAGLASGRTGIAEPGTVVVISSSSSPPMRSWPVSERPVPAVSKLLNPWLGSSSWDGSVRPKFDGLVRV